MGNQKGNVGYSLYRAGREQSPRNYNDLTIAGAANSLSHKISFEGGGKEKISRRKY